ncbi:hypothetical protein Tco_0602417 [Tanacetum coccineum]
MLKIGKGRDRVYFNFPFSIKLAIGLNVYPWDPSPVGRISLPVSLLKFSHREELLNLKWHLDVPTTSRRTIDQPAGGNLCDKNAKESWALIEDLSLYDNESWNDPRDFAKPVKAISLPHDVPNASDRRLIELKNQV